jgi:DNA-binding SARP family transcriptional activator
MSDAFALGYTSAMGIRIGALGSLSAAWHDGSVVPLVPRATPTLLLAILVAGEGMTRTEADIAAILWPRADESERDPIENIGKILFTLRSKFKESAPAGAPSASEIVQRGDGYLRLDPAHVTVDAFEIERDALDVLASPMSAARIARASETLDALAREFVPELRRERVAAEVRERLAAVRRRLFETTYDALRATDAEAASDLLERAFVATPADAKLASRYISALALERRLDRAWRAYERHAAARGALGLDAAPEVGELLVSSREPIIAFGGGDDDARPLVGRELERTALAEALSATAVEGGRIVIVAAEGRGRSRMLREAVAPLRADGALVGAARGLFGLAADRVVRDLHRSLLAAKAGREGARIVVKLSGDAVPGELRGPLLELKITIADLLRAGRRVVLALDDAHFLDRVALAEIEYALEETGITFVTTARAGLDRFPSRAHRIDLGDLPPAAERAAIEGLLGTALLPESEARLRALWPGNLAFLLAAAERADDEAYAEALDDGTLRLCDDVPDSALLPEAFASRFEARLRGMLKHAQVVAAAMTVVRRPLLVAELAALSAFPVEAVEEHVRNLRTAGLIWVDGDRVGMPPAIALVAARFVSRERYLDFEHRSVALLEHAQVPASARSDSASSVSRTT